MKLLQLQLLKTVVENGLNISRAGEQHFIVQSAVSRQLSQLEEELGLSLFERAGKRLVAPTPLASFIAEQVDHIELTLDNIRVFADQARDPRVGEFCIATTHTQAKYFLPSAMAVFKSRYPKVNIRFMQGAPAELVRMLHDREADIAVCTEELDEDPSLETWGCYQWNHGIVVPKGHPLEKGDLTLERIADYPILTYVFGFTGRARIHDTFIQQGLTPNIALAATDTDVIKSYVRLGFGVGIIANMAMDDGDDDLVLRDLSHCVPYSMTRIAYLKDKYLKVYEQECIDILREHGAKAFGGA